MAETPTFFLYDLTGDRFIELSDGILFGRTKGEQVFEGDTLMSSRHLRIMIHDGKALVEDLGSTNGTRVNGKVIPANKRVALSPSDKLEFGDQKMVFTDRREKPSAKAAPAPSKPKASEKVELMTPAPAPRPAQAPRQAIRAGGPRPSRSGGDLPVAWIALAVLLLGGGAALHFYEAPFTSPEKLGSSFLLWSIGGKAAAVVAAAAVYWILAKFVFPAGWMRGIAVLLAVIAFPAALAAFATATGFRPYKTVVPFAFRCAVLFDGRACTLGLAQLNRAELETIPAPASQWAIGKASANLSEACAAKDAEACYGLGTFFLLSGDGAKALQARIAACTFDHAAACFEMGSWAMNNGNPKEGGALIQKACSLGVAKACQMAPKP